MLSALCLSITVAVIADIILERRRLARVSTVLSCVRSDIQEAIREYRPVMVLVTGAGPWRSTQSRHAAAPVVDVV
jgi:hypothetical protein